MTDKYDEIKYNFMEFVLLEVDRYEMTNSLLGKILIDKGRHDISGTVEIPSDKQSSQLFTNVKYALYHLEDPRRSYNGESIISLAEKTGDTVVINLLKWLCD